MRKLMLVSVLFAFVLIPALAARQATPGRGMRRVLIWTFLFACAYAVGVGRLYLR